MQKTWYFAPKSLANDQGFVVVATLPPHEARAVQGLQQQVETIYRGVLGSTEQYEEDDVVSTAKGHFAGDSAPDQGGEPNNLLVFAFLGTGDAANDMLTSATKVVGFSRVFENNEWGQTITCTPLTVLQSLEKDPAFAVAEALHQVTQEIGVTLAQRALRCQEAAAGGEKSIQFWRNQSWTSDRVKELFKADGFSGPGMDGLEMTKFLSDQPPLAASDCLLPQGICIKPFDLETDDLAKIYSVWQLAYGQGGGHLPTREVWQKMYLEAPRLATELSVVAWNGDELVSGVFLEYIVDGEGGGNPTVSKIMEMSIDAAADDQGQQPVRFPADYDGRYAAIRASAACAYVCSAATLPEYRGKRLARVLLRAAFAKAQQVGLEKVYLCVDRSNEAAVKAYMGAGMVDTTVSGTMVVAEIKASP